MPTNDPISDPLPDEPPMIEVWVDVGEGASAWQQRTASDGHRRRRHDAAFGPRNSGR